MTDEQTKIAESEQPYLERNSVPLLVPGYGSRISAAAKLVGDRKAAADAASVSVDTLQRYIRETTQPSLPAIAGLAAAAGVSIDWIAFGKVAVADRSGLDPGSEGLDDFAKVPVYDVAASAGAGAIAEDQAPERHLAFRRDWLVSHGLSIKDLAVIEVRGDSMSPTINAGDTVLVDTSDTAIGMDAIYVLRLDGHLYAKRCQRGLDGTVRVISDNPAYQEQTISASQLAELHVVGRVVWAGRFLI